MKICCVGDGTSIHMQRWVNYFARTGHEVHLICWKLMPGFDEKVKIHYLTRLAPRLWPVSQYASFLFWIFQVRRLTRRIRPDIVDGHFVTVYGFLAACSGFHPLVVTSWGSDLLIQPRHNPLARFTARYALKKGDAVICRVPVDIAHEVMSRLGVTAKDTRRVLLGVDTSAFTPSSRDNNLKQVLGIGSSQSMVISTRALAPIYDVETLVRAIPYVLAEARQTVFVIAGTGKQKRYLEELAARLGVSSNARFVGWIPRDELPRYLSTAHIYVSSSLSDGTPNSLLEAMACELAPVVTDIPANRPWIKDGDNGFLFPPRRYKLLASKIVHLLNNDQARESFGRKSRAIVQETGEEETEMQKLDTVYHELVAANQILREQANLSTPKRGRT